MITVEKISATEWGKAPTYRDEKGNEYTERYCFENYKQFTVTNMNQGTFERMAKRHNARQSSRKRVRPSDYGTWDSGQIVKEQLTDKLVGRQR